MRRFFGMQCQRAADLEPQDRATSWGRAKLLSSTLVLDRNRFVVTKKNRSYKYGRRSRDTPIIYSPLFGMQCRRAADLEPQDALRAGGITADRERRSQRRDLNSRVGWQ